MHLESISGKLTQLGRMSPALWPAFLNGWRQRRQNGFVPCAVAGGRKLLNVPPADFYESYEFFCERPQGHRELDFFLGKLRPGDVVYDIGGFRGAYSMAARLKLDAAGSIHVFEPLAKNVESIRRICALNHFTGIHINALAVGDGGALAGNVNEQYAMLRLGDRQASATATDFPSISLDDYVTRGAPAPAVIKLDVDGFELHVLHGAHECLRRHRPRLWLEIHPTYLAEQGRSPDDVLNLLRATGYAIVFYDDSNSPDSKFSYHVWCE
jgi:FkbM family methyltransferase